MGYQVLPDSQYDAFTAIRRHSHSNGLAMMPTAGAFPQSASIVVLNGGLDMDFIGYAATRRGEPPQIPAPISTNPNRVFLAGERTGMFPMTDVAGVITYVVTGWFRFGILSPEGLASDFMLGDLPFPGVQTGQYIPGGYFLINLINQNLTQTLTNNVPPIPPLIQGIINKG